MEQLDDLAARHAVHLTRYSSYTLNQITKILSKVDNRIVLQIMDLTDGMTQREVNEFLKGKYSTKRLVSLHEAINELSAETRQATSTILGANGKDLAGYEIKYSEKVLSALPNVAIGGTVTPSQAYAAATSRPLLGVHVRDMVKNLEPDLKRKLSAEIRESYLLGENSGTLARRIRGTAAQKGADGLLSRRNRNIETLVRTSMTHISNIASQESYKANGVDKIVYRSTLDGNTTPRCISLDGNVYPIDKGPRPPQHYGCRSSILPYVDDMDWTRPSVQSKKKMADIPKADRKNLVKQVPASKSFTEWFEGTNAEFKEELLGPSRYKLYKEGVPFKRFSDPSGKRYTLEQLEKRDNIAFKSSGLKSRAA